LGIAVAMHLYPLCVPQCLPLPRLSLARFQRAMLLRAIRSRSLILANAGGERTRGAEHSLVARQEAEGLRIDGTFEYMSLATVADIVLFKARLANGNATVLCAADLRADSVRIGDWKFAGSMRLSDTSSVTFAGHRVPRGRYLLVADDEVLRCSSDYQRCWFHLFLADMYLARPRTPASGLGPAAFGRTAHEPQRDVAASSVRASPPRRPFLRIRHHAVEEDHQRDEAARLPDGTVDDGFTAKPGSPEPRGSAPASRRLGRARLHPVAADRR
jgi:hypothetical protein